MHDQVRDFLRRMVGRWPAAVAGAHVVEFGAYNVNGSARDVWGTGASSLDASQTPRSAAAPGMDGAAAPTAATWLGVDWRPGPGVDVALLTHDFPMPERLFDVAVSTEMLEHDPFWRESLRRMIAVVRPGGCVFLTCAGPGRPAHEVDCAPSKAEPYYQGVGLREVVAWAQGCAAWDVVYGEAHGAPDDTYVALVGKHGGAGGSVGDRPQRVGAGPVVSVVVPCVGNVALTRRCVASLVATTANRWELILVENGSTPGHREALADIVMGDGRCDDVGMDDGRCGMWPERVVFLSWDRMLGYPAAVNRGIAAASGAFVCLLNNDTEVVTPGWDGVLIEALEGTPEAVIVSPVCDFVANPAQDCRTAAPGRAEVETLCFVAALMRRELFEQVGLLDEDFGLGNWEDREFCVRARRAGGRLVVEPAAFLHHAGHGTFRRMRPGVFEGLLRDGERLFRAKVG